MLEIWPPNLKIMSLEMLYVNSSDVNIDYVELLALNGIFHDCKIAEITGFDCVIQSERVGMKTGGVAIYQRNTISIMAIPHTIEMLSSSYDEQLGVSDGYGNICAAEVFAMGTRILLVSLYISPDTTIKQKKYFLTRNLFLYLAKKLPIVVTGNFNIDVTKEEHTEFVEFMRKYLGLSFASNSTQATCLDNSCLDLMFTRNISAECKPCSSNMSYRWPILSELGV